MARRVLRLISESLCLAIELSIPTKDHNVLLVKYLIERPVEPKAYVQNRGLTYVQLQHADRTRCASCRHQWHEGVFDKPGSHCINERSFGEKKYLSQKSSIKESSS